MIKVQLEAERLWDKERLQGLAPISDIQFNSMPI